MSGFRFKLLPPLVVVMNCLGLCGHPDTAQVGRFEGVWIDEKPAALLESGYTKCVKWVGFSKNAGWGLGSE